MEYYMVARALKPSLRRELASKSNQQAIFEDFCCYNSNNGVVSAEDFSVDCFLDLSSGEPKENYNFEDLEVEEEKDYISSQAIDDDYSSNLTNFSDNFLTNQISVPDEDLAELEWVSHFVDDSSSELPISCPNFFQSQPKPDPFLTKPSSPFPAKIPAKARSKRTRPTGRTWSIGSSITDSSSSSSSTITSSSASTPCEPPLKKPKKQPTAKTRGIMGSTQFQRRCSHCQVQKTPQWRTGPLGAKTLCNACGVRYKSGRLFPEYRPASSPTFSVAVHSNSHRKVLEIRKKKEMIFPVTGLNAMVHNF